MDIGSSYPPTGVQPFDPTDVPILSPVVLLSLPSYEMLVRMHGVGGSPTTLLESDGSTVPVKG